MFSLPPPDTPSSPSIDRVEPYSSTAQVEFDEPEATGGVPILKYKAEWRALGEGEWHSRLYDAKEGRMIKQEVISPACNSNHILSCRQKPEWRLPELCNFSSYIKFLDKFLNVCFAVTPWIFGCKCDPSCADRLSHTYSFSAYRVCVVALCSSLCPLLVRTILAEQGEEPCGWY